MEEDADARGRFELARERGGHQHELVALDPDDLVLLVATLETPQQGHICITTRAIASFTCEYALNSSFISGRFAKMLSLLNLRRSPAGSPHVHAVVQHRPQNLLAEAVVVLPQHRLLQKHREAVQLAQRLLHLLAVLGRDLDVQRDAPHVARLAASKPDHSAHLLNVW